MNLKSHNEQCPAVELQEDFDTGRFGGMWYSLLMSNDLPFGPVDCQTQGIKTLDDGSMEYIAEWYELDTGKSSDMNGPMWCSAWESGKCSIGVFGGGSNGG